MTRPFFSTRPSLRSVRRITTAVSTRSTRVAVVMVCRVLLLSGSVIGVAKGAPELTWPFFTVSDVLATSGGRIMYASWVASLVVWLPVNGMNSVFSTCGAVAVCAPLFPVPCGTPFVWQHLLTSPVQSARHFAWAATFIACAFAGLVRARYWIAMLVATFACMFSVGQWLGSPWLVAGGCMVEWGLMFLPMFYMESSYTTSTPLVITRR
jgi:hypothetical protein